MYKIIGADQKEYGPVSAEQLRQWMAEGRVNRQTMVRPDGATEWKPLSTFPELSGEPAPLPPQFMPQPGLKEEFFARDYVLDIGDCIAKGWDLLKNNFGTIFGGVAIFFLVQLGMGALGGIPFIGWIVSLANFVITGPLTGGLYYFLLQNIRGQRADIGEIFSGFRLGFLQLFLAYLVSSLLIGVSAIPGVAIMIFPIIMMVHHGGVEAGPLLWALLGLVVTFIPMVYLGVSWLFSIALVIDKRLDFWQAMNTSRKMVGKHWWAVFGLVVVSGLLNIAGVLACCVGLFITVPIGMCAWMYAYEIIFSAPVGPVQTA